MSSAETLLGVWAHPDDEAYLSAALMASTRRGGGHVVVATATLGEQGVVDGAVGDPENVAALRAAEQRQALLELDVTDARWLGYADGTLADQDAEPAISAISSLIEEVQPTLLVTFGPDGMTGHSDHRTVSAWVTAAWNRTGRRAPLWYATATDRWHQRWDEVNQSVGLWFKGSTPPRAATASLAAQLRCDGELRETKYRALRAHASQTRALEGLVGTETYKDWWGEESFVAAR